MRSRFAHVAALAILVAAPVSAQLPTSLAQSAPTPLALTPSSPTMPAAPADSLGQPKGAFTFMPLGLLVGYFAAEYEMKAGDASTIGIAASYFDPPDGSSGHYSTVELKARYYPNETPIRGFSLGGSVGMTSITGTTTTCSGTCTDSHVTYTKPTAEVLVDYNWLLGKRQQFLVGTGVGVKRIFNVSADNVDLPIFYPTLRLMFGWAVR